MNGTIWTLIALDSGNYETSDPTIRQQCVDAILAARHNDGGWSLVTAKAQPSNVDITCMALTALYPYRDQEAVAAACAEAIQWLSDSQLATGGFPYGTGETLRVCFSKKDGFAAREHRLPYSAHLLPSLFTVVS